MELPQIKGGLKDLDLDSLRSADSPLLRWSLAAILLILAWIWLVEPLQEWRDSLSGAVERDARQAVRMRNLEVHAEDWSASRQESEQLLSNATEMLFTQSSDTAAQAALQQWVAGQLRNRELSVTAQRYLESEVLPGVGVRVRLFVDFSGDVDSVLQFLDDLSRAQYLVDVEQWLMRRNRRGNIQVQATLAGYRADFTGSVNNDG